MVPDYDSSQARTGIEGLTRPDPKDRAGQIVAWAICWPWNFVWTCFVYNPFRYIGEFLLKEIQSALFEISKRHFSAIERDLTLDPSPPPFPIHERPVPGSADSDSGNGDAASVSVAPASDAVVVDDAPGDNRSGTISPTVEAPTQQSPETSGTELTPAGSLPSATGRQPDSQSETPGDSQGGAVDSLPTEAAEDLAESESSDSYAWAPPEPTPFVVMSNRPLGGLRVPRGNRQSEKTASTGSSPNPPADQ